MKRKLYIIAIVCLLLLVSGCWELPEDIPEFQGGQVSTGSSSNIGDSGDSNDTSFEISAGAPGSSCKRTDNCYAGLHCINDVCCQLGETCCASDSDCQGNVVCMPQTYICAGECFSSEVENDALCAVGYTCENLLGCQPKLEGGEACNENSDCTSAACLQGHCCQHEGLCCETDNDCGDMFFGCDAAAPTWQMTCAFGDFPLPDSGQTFCVNVTNERTPCSSFQEGTQYFGQDGHYTQSSPSHSEVITGEITDVITHLIWQKTSSTNAMTYKEAQAYCVDTWRLPSRLELHTIVNYGTEVTDSWMLYSSFDAPADNTREFWTATTLSDSGGAPLAWQVDFQKGSILKANTNSATGHVRCVKDEI